MQYYLNRELTEAQGEQRQKGCHMKDSTTRYGQKMRMARSYFSVAKVHATATLLYVITVRKEPETDAMLFQTRFVV